MSTAPVQDVLSNLNAIIQADPSVAPKVCARWRSGQFEAGSDISPEAAEAAELVELTMPGWSHTAMGDEIDGILASPSSEVLFLWASTSVDRADVALSPIVEAASKLPEHAPRAKAIARNRIIQGPMVDALLCVPLMGKGSWLSEQGNVEASARMEILLWEAGACAMQMPELGKWIWDDAETFEAVIARPAAGSLRGRVLAARCIEVSACGMPAMTDPQLVGRTLQVLQPLLLHPEPMVWIHAARAFGRMAGVFEPLEGTLLDWVHQASPVLRQRALVAFASLPASRLAFLGHELESILDSPDEGARGLSAAAAATPYLFHERRKLWDRLAKRIIAGDGGPTAIRALARGLATLWRRGHDRKQIKVTFRKLRELARRASTSSTDDWRRWLETTAVTDPIDAAERDPLDIETGLENLVRIAAQYDDEEADARASRFAGTLASTFTEAYKNMLGDGSLRHRASAINAVEGCARSLALRLWGPMLATRPEGDPMREPDLEETWTTVAKAPAELLDLVRERRQEGSQEPGFELALEVLALKLGGYALDACGEEGDLGASRGPTAHDTCLWLRKLDGLVDGSRELPPELQSALSAVFWRLVDATRGTALGEVDDVEWLGPFAAWWALVIDRPAILQQLATALPMIRQDALDKCCELADETRAVLSAGLEDGQWGETTRHSLGEMNASDTELAVALDGLARALEHFADAAGPRPTLDKLCLELVLAADRLQAALADPVRALRSSRETPSDDSIEKNGPRTAAMVARAIRSRELSLLDVWFASLGPTASALVEAAVSAAVGRTPPPPPQPKKETPKSVVGYELVKALGEGGVGSVFLVRKANAERLFVLKIPKAEALSNATDTEREGILNSFVDEARALAGLYHPNVANIIDRGVENGLPYLVLEYLIGADLKEYSTGNPMSLFELRRVVDECCAGLTALHNAGLVHRDIKPANIWLRLPLARGVRFDPEKHRDPAKARPLSSVLIDFGMVRAQKVAPEVGGRFVAGTPGYIAPEQVLDPVELDGRADVYALAGTIYNVTSGRTFFDDIDDSRQRILAHMRRDPMEDASRFEQYPASLVKLMRAATNMKWQDRPTPAEFGKEFIALI